MLFLLDLLPSVEVIRNALFDFHPFDGINRSVRKASSIETTIQTILQTVTPTPVLSLFSYTPNPIILPPVPTTTIDDIALWAPVMTTALETAPVS